MAGVFIVFEGGEGSGKSTQVQVLADRLRESGRTVVVTREPGGSPRAERIREMILAEPMSPRTEALLFAAARADHVAETIRPALDRGDVVISDRYLDSSVAYQGVARGLGAEEIRRISEWATDELIADVTIVLDIEPRIGLARALDGNRMEAESLAFHDAVRGAFLAFAAASPDRYRVIDAGLVRHVVAEQVARAVAAAVGPVAHDGTREDGV